jgi:hypothetical protein
MDIATFAIVILIGATLGFRFKVLILFPAMGLVTLGVVSIGIARGDHGYEVILAIILIAAVLQIGYLLGTVARAVVAFTVVPSMKRVWVHDR